MIRSAQIIAVSWPPRRKNAKVGAKSTLTARYQDSDTRLRQAYWTSKTGRIRTQRIHDGPSVSIMYGNLIFLHPLNGSFTICAC